MMIHAGHEPVNHEEVQRMAVRSVSNRGGNIIGMFPSLKMQRPVRYESTIERDLCYLLEFDPHVIRYVEQPFTITQPTHDGTTHRYTPDFQIFRTHGVCDLVECKPAARLDDPHTRQQLEMGHAWADAHQHTFRLVTDHDVRHGALLENVRLLWRSCRMPVAHDLVVRTIAYLTESPGATIAQTAAAALQRTAPRQHVPYLCTLLFQHVVITDLTMPLSCHSRLWLPTHGAQEG
jgi:hypothetical protein